MKKVVQRWSNRWTLGCVNLPPEYRDSQGAESRNLSTIPVRFADKIVDLMQFDEERRSVGSRRRRQREDRRRGI